MANFRFHRLHFRCSFCDVLAEIAHLAEIAATNFPILLAFNADSSCLFLGQFLLFDPEKVFFLFCHGFSERGVLMGGPASRSPGMYVSVFID
ncbi:hypothetical protein N665_0218s0107 [Sinapis alba]|nr:hypothetical protein N665_0218s0107 [Sinapis alba]